ncbi:MAG: hypothetical protein ACC608_13225 [Anaerofustis sp.]
MEQKKTVLEVMDEIKQKELDFLPPDDMVREGFLFFVKFMMLAS